MTANRWKLDEEAQKRNALMLSGYEYEKYPEAITGFNGMNLQQVTFCRREPAARVRVGPRGNYKGVVCRLGDGALRLAVCRRVTDVGLFGIHVYASDDEGLTWEETGPAELYGKEMSLTAVPDGSLLMTVESKAFVADTTQMNIYRSSDGGCTWQSHLIDGPETPRNLIVEPDGGLLMVRALRSAHQKARYDDEGKPYVPSSNLELLRSGDGGRSWVIVEGQVDWDNSRFGEVSSVRLPNGDLLASLRAMPPGAKGREGEQVTYITKSSDDGKTWSAPRAMTNTAEVQVVLLLLEDGRLLATYTNYHLPFGVCAIVSEDDGETWSNDTPVQLAISADCFTGWASTVQLPDGDLITSYAITAYLNQPPNPGGAERNVCEVVRWQLPK